MNIIFGVYLIHHSKPCSIYYVHNEVGRVLCVLLALARVFVPIPTLALALLRLFIEDTNDLDLSALYFLAFIPKQHLLSNIQLEDTHLLDEQVKKMRKQWALKV